MTGVPAHRRAGVPDPGRAHSPLNAKLGIRTDDLPDGRVQLSLVTDASMQSEGGSVHGGIHALLLDGAMGRCVVRTLEPGQDCATVQLSIQYLAPASGRIAALGRIVRRGRTMAFVEGECAREDGTVVARAHGTWLIR